MKKIISSLLILSVLVIGGSCKKVEGPGGSSTIKGKLHAVVHDGAGNLINEYDLHDHDVYIIYGSDAEETFYDDDVKSSYDGTFEFNYLEKGSYRVFIYEKCTTCPSGKDVVMMDVEITDKKSTVDLGTINIEK
jgi:hypothetical protein